MTPWTSPPDSSVHGIFQLRILEWIAIASCRGSSWPRDWTQISCIGRSRQSHQGSPRLRITVVNLRTCWWLLPSQHQLFFFYNENCKVLICSLPTAPCCLTSELMLTSLHYYKVCSWRPWSISFVPVQSECPSSVAHLEIALITCCQPFSLQDQSIETELP